MTIRQLAETIEAVNFPVSETVVVICLFIAISATYNAYLLRGGKLAWSQLLIVLAMVSFIFSLLGKFLPKVTIFAGVRLTDILLIVGFGLLLVASLRLHSALK